ncbi:MAG TPA: alpha/beta hydrolase [Xanthomonadales bacterium]|nr:alpha/beta hydrolase [Xanthomonadales bacterium]
MSINALLVHGAGGGAWEWHVWRRVFAAAGARADAIELAPVAAGLPGTRLADYVGQVRATALALPAPRVLVGASLGGLIATLVADAVEAAALVLVNPGIGRPANPGSPTPGRRSRDGVVAWSRTGIARTRRAMPDADDAACLYAAARWRDESAAALDDARVAQPAPPRCPVLVLASERDDDVPCADSRALAQEWRSDFVQLSGASHVGPLLGRDAARVAELALGWLETRRASQGATRA